MSAAFNDVTAYQTTDVELSFRLPMTVRSHGHHPTPTHILSSLSKRSRRYGTLSVWSFYCSASKSQQRRSTRLSSHPRITETRPTNASLLPPFISPSTISSNARTDVDTQCPPCLGDRRARCSHTSFGPKPRCAQATFSDNATTGKGQYNLEADRRSSCCDFPR